MDFDITAITGGDNQIRALARCAEAGIHPDTATAVGNGLDMCAAPRASHCPCSVTLDDPEGVHTTVTNQGERATIDKNLPSSVCRHGSHADKRENQKKGEDAVRKTHDCLLCCCDAHMHISTDYNEKKREIKKQN